jgi:hypothetical protein
VLRPRLLLLPLVTILLGGAAAPAVAATVVRSGSGANVDTAMQQFRGDLGNPLDITWEEADLPTPLANPFTYSGLTLSTAGSGFEIDDSGTFPTQSPPKLLQTHGTAAARFTPPGQSTPSVVRGFGAVFSNALGSGARIDLLGADGSTLASAAAPNADLSFVGVSITNPRVAEVRITVGDALLDNVMFGQPFPDGDRDGIPTVQDNCPFTANPGQENLDKDELGNVCDPDADNDRIPNERDAFPLDKSETTDTDGDGVGDNKDADDDNDGLTDRVEGRLGTDRKNADTDADGAIDGQDNCPAIPNPTQADADGDGRGDACADMVTPVLTRLALRPATFRRGSKHGSKVSFRMSEPAFVRLSALRLVTGHRVGPGCVRGAPRAGKRQLACRVYVPVRGTINRTATSGTNFVKFEGRIGGRWMKPGRYLLAAGSTDLSGNASPIPAFAKFTIVP